MASGRVQARTLRPVRNSRYWTRSHLLRVRLLRSREGSRQILNCLSRDVRWMPVAVSFAPDVCRLDDGPPLLDFRFLVGGKPFRRLLRLRENLLSKLCNPCAQAGVGERRLHRGIKRCDDLPWCSPGHPKTDPSE